jgi:hypothetical protein
MIRNVTHEAARIARSQLAAFAAPKRIGLKSHIRLSGVLVKMSSSHVTRRFNASSARLNKPQGLDLR